MNHNSRKRKREADTCISSPQHEENLQSNVRVGIAIVVHYIPNTQCSDRIIFDALHTLGLEVEIKDIKSKKHEQPIDSLVNEISVALKDHNSSYAIGICERSLTFLSESNIVNDSLESSPGLMTIVNSDLSERVQISCHNLSSDGLRLQMHNCTDKHTESELPYRPKEPSGIEVALECTRDFMFRNGYALHKGAVYTKPLGAKHTYVKFFSVEAFVNRLAGNRSLSSCLLPHLTSVIKVLSNANCDFIRQIDIDYDLIEVQNEMAWHITRMEFVELNLCNNVTPRAYCNYDPNSIPNACHFKSSVINSFQEPETRNLFLIKWYQLLLHGKFLHKSRKLMVCGPKDSGKSTWVLPIMGIIPKDSVASLTKEKQFSCAMLNPETQLVFVDELNEELLTAEQAKAVLQGGFMPVPRKHKTAEGLEYNSPFFITGQRVPNWGPEEDENVKRRLEIFLTKPLMTTRPEIAEWLSNNSMPCIVWAAQTVQAARHTMSEDEFFFLPEKATFEGRRKKIQELKDQENKIREGNLKETFFQSEGEMLCTSFDPELDTSVNQSSSVSGDSLNLGASQGTVAICDDERAGPSNICHEKRFPPCSTPLHEPYYTPVDFEISSFNDEEYMVEVKSRLDNMPTDSCHYLSHIRRKERLEMEVRNKIVHEGEGSLAQKESKKKILLNDLTLLYAKPDPEYDAWSCVTGKHRSAFDLKGFFNKFPSSIDRIEAIRSSLLLRPSTVKLPNTVVLDEVNKSLQDLVEKVVGNI